MRATCARVSAGFAEPSMPITRRARSWRAKPAIIPACVLPVTEQTTIVSKKTPSSRSCASTSSRPAGEPEAAELVVRRAGRDRVRRAAGGLDVGERLLPALLEADPEPGPHEAHVGAHDPAELDVAHAVVDDVGPVDPALLHEHAAHARCAPRRPRPGGCGWTARRRSRRACRSPSRARRRRGTRACASCCRRRRGRCCSRRAWPRSCAPPRCAVSRSSRWTGEGPKSSG